MLGSQNRIPMPDEDRSDMLIAWGWNGMQSHQMPQAPLVLKEFADNPDKILAAVDPRKSKTGLKVLGVAYLHCFLPVWWTQDSSLIERLKRKGCGSWSNCGDASFVAILISARLLRRTALSAELISLL